MFFTSAAAFLPLLWIVPIISLLPAAYFSIKRAYKPKDIVALADSLSGGSGTLLTLSEKNDAAWAETPLLGNLTLPKLNPWRKLGPVIAAALFLSIALFVPQRTLSNPRSKTIASDVVADLKSAAEILKKENLLTPEEQKKLEEEIERIQKDAEERMDSSTWEAADTLREKVASELKEKHDAMQWAQEALSRYADAAQGGAPPTGPQSEELEKALEKLAKSGMLNDASSEVKQNLGGDEAVGNGKVSLPKDPAKLKALAAQIAKHLGDRNKRFSEIAKLAKAVGRFDPAEFGDFSYEEGTNPGDPDSRSNRWGIDHERGDADLTWGDESLPFNKFKSVALPPGSVRSADDWAPVAELPGAPEANPEAAGPSTGARFAGTSGQAAWRRTLSPRHYSAVKRYFDNSTKH
jgi:hypothetical protein